MAPPKLTDEERIASALKRKAYLKEYRKTMPIELARIYRRNVDPEKMKAINRRKSAKRSQQLREKKASGLYQIPLKQQWKKENKSV